MNKINIMKKIANCALELDIKGFKKEADVLTLIMKKISSKDDFINTWELLNDGGIICRCGKILEPYEKNHDYGGVCENGHFIPIDELVVDYVSNQNDKAYENFKYKDFS